jgi:hypothetical protein
MALLDLHEWSLAALVAALLAASLAWPGQAPAPGAHSDTAVCERPGFATISLMLTPH